MAKQSSKLLKQDETYLDTPYKVMQAIERTIGRKFTIVEIGQYYHMLHNVIDGNIDRSQLLVYSDKGVCHTFNVVFNSELTTVIVKV